MKKTFDEIQDEIIEKFIDSEYMGVSETEELLTNICGQYVSFYDSVIDDGICDSKDDYVMRDCFSTADDKITIRIYYGNYTKYIGYVSVTN